MTPAVRIIAGFLLGGSAGLLAGRDFLRAALGAREAPVRRAVLGMLRRSGIFLAVLAGAVLFGGLAWAGAAAGYLALFTTVALRRVAVHGR